MGNKSYNTKAAAKYLENIGVPFSPGTLEVWRSYGRGPRFKRVARRVFYSQADLDEFAKGQVIETTDSIDYYQK